MIYEVIKEIKGGDCFIARIQMAKHQSLMLSLRNIISLQIKKVYYSTCQNQKYLILNRYIYAQLHCPHVKKDPSRRVPVLLLFSSIFTFQRTLLCIHLMSAVLSAAMFDIDSVFSALSMSFGMASFLCESLYKCLYKDKGVAWFSRN